MKRWRVEAQMSRFCLRGRASKKIRARAANEAAGPGERRKEKEKKIRNEREGRRRMSVYPSRKLSRPRVMRWDEENRKEE